MRTTGVARFVALPHGHSPSSTYLLVDVGGPSRKGRLGVNVGFIVGRIGVMRLSYGCQLGVQLEVALRCTGVYFGDQLGVMLKITKSRRNSLV